MHLPELAIPFTSAVNPRADVAEDHTRRFVRRFGLLPTDEAAAHFDESRLGHLVGRTCPRAALPALGLLADWMGANLVLDDLFDETDIGKDPARMRRFCDEVLQWLPADGVVTTTDRSPFAMAYTDLWQRTCDRMGPTWRRRFAADFGRFLDHCVWEAHNRAEGGFRASTSTSRCARARSCPTCTCWRSSTTGRSHPQLPGRRGWPS